MGILTSACGKFEILVNDEDLPVLRRHNWHVNWDAAQKRWRHPRTTIQGTPVFLHRFVLGTPPLRRGIEIDHINRNRLDNRVENLRWVSRADNKVNQGPDPRNKSGYKGVWHDKARGRWLARGGSHKSPDRLSAYFDTFDEAKAARLRWEQEYWERVNHAASARTMIVTS
jgi:hypothetical protein